MRSRDRFLYDHKGTPVFLILQIWSVLVSEWPLYLLYLGSPHVITVTAWPMTSFQRSNDKHRLRHCLSISPSSYENDSARCMHHHASWLCSNLIFDLETTSSRVTKGHEAPTSSKIWLEAGFLLFTAHPLRIHCAYATWSLIHASNISCCTTSHLDLNLSRSKDDGCQWSLCVSGYDLLISSCVLFRLGRGWFSKIIHFVDEIRWA